MRVFGSPAPYADEDRWRADAAAAFDRSFTPGRHRPPVLRRRGVRARAPTALRQLDVPTLVIHGSADTLIDPIGGRRTAELIPGARFELIEGMGHDYPPALWERWVDLVVGHALGRPPRPTVGVTAARRRLPRHPHPRRRRPGDRCR